MSDQKFNLWRPSFAGSWRCIGQFDTKEQCNAYAASKPWKEHGCFTDWLVLPDGELPNTTQIEPSSSIMGTAVSRVTEIPFAHD